tara:strand:+ start:54 stop:443 length:390 start_codon:yes stop_codon:yes gene_type:complete
MKISKQQLKQIIKEELQSVLEGEESEADKILQRMRSEPQGDFISSTAEADGFYPDMGRKMERKKKHYAIVNGERVELNSVFHQAKQVLGGTPEGMKQKLQMRSSSFRGLPEWLQDMVIKYVSKNYSETY